MSSRMAALACVVIVLSLAETSHTKTVVIIPFLFPSHVNYHINVAHALTKRGHQAWVTIPDYILEKNFLNTSGLNVIPFASRQGLQKQYEELLGATYFEGKSSNIFKIYRFCTDMFDRLLKNDSFISTIQRTNPDLIVIDNVNMFYAMTIIPYRLGIPFAVVGSFYFPFRMGIPFSPADVPIAILPYSNTMGFIQRLHTSLTYLIGIMYDPGFPVDAVSVYAPEKEYVPLNELLCRADIFIIDYDHVMDYPLPTVPNVKLVGGLAVAPVKPLPPEFQSFMDSAKEGVAIVSFGSYVLHLPNHIKDKIFHVLLQLPFKSVFRSNVTSPDPKKILTSPWIPQNDLLGHPHTKVFVSHCGNSGQYEALYNAVPIVATPLFTDQPYNAERARVKGFAEVLDLNSCTADQMKSTILTVANEPRYKQAVVKRSRLFRELYGVPRETAAYWLDHVVEYGGDYMRSAGQQMPFYQFMLLDVMLFIVLVVVLAVGLVCLLCRVLCRCCCKRKVKTQ